MSLSRAALSVVACEGGTLADFDALPRNDPAGRRPQRRPTTPSDFDAVYAEWFEGVLRWAAAMGVRNSDKYDVAQNVFLVVMRRLHDFDRRNMAGWLYTITARQVKDYQMQLWNRRIFRTAEPIPEELPSGAATPAMSLENSERRELLRGLLGRLSDPMRNAVILFDLHGFSCEEIALMGASRPTRFGPGCGAVARRSWTWSRGGRFDGTARPHGALAKHERRSNGRTGHA